MNEPNVNDINLTIKGFDFLNEEDSEVYVQFILSFYFWTIVLRINLTRYNI